MVYTKRTTTTKRRTNRKKKVNTVKKLNNKVNRMFSTMKPELKVSDSNVVDQALHSPSAGVSSNWYISFLPDPALTTGTSYYNQRVGSSIRIRSIQVKAVVRFQGSAVVASTIRFLMVRFPKSDVLPLSSVISNVTEKLAVNSPFNTITRDTFQILWDKRVTLNNFGNDSKHVGLFKKCNLPVNYIADGTSVEDGQIVLYAFSDTNSSEGPLLDIYQRVRYTDV